MINKLDNLLSQNERGSMAHITEYDDNSMNKKQSDLNIIANNGNEVQSINNRINNRFSLADYQTIPESQNEQIKAKLRAPLKS